MVMFTVGTMIKVKVNVDNVLNSIEAVRRVVLLAGNSVIEESAREYAAQLKQNIITQKYGSFGKPFGGESKGKWKRGISTSKYWYWLGTVLKVITPIRVKSKVGEVTWRVGVTDKK